MPLRGADAFKRKLDRIPEETYKRISTTVVRGTLLIEADAKRLATDSVDTSNLRAKIHRDLKQEPQKITGEVVSDEVYSMAVEFGTRPHFPPVDALKDWARRKLGDESAAFPVARSISKRGTKPQPFMRPAAKKNFPTIQRQLGKDLKDAMRRA